MNKSKATDIFNQLPQELREVGDDIYWDNFDEEGAFRELAEELVNHRQKEVRLTEVYQDTSIELLQGTCIALLNVFFPLEEVKLLLEDSEYEPKPYQSIQKAQAKLTVAIVRVTLERTVSYSFLDEHLASQPEARSSLLERTLGKIARAGFLSQFAAQKPRDKRKEDTFDKHKWFIDMARDMDRKHNGQLSAQSIAQLIHEKEGEWRKHLADPLSVDRIAKIIRKHVTKKNR